MAVGRIELTPNEFRWLLEVVKASGSDSPEAAKALRQNVRAVRELKRGLRRAEESEARDEQRRAAIRRNRMTIEERMGR